MIFSSGSLCFDEIVVGFSSVLEFLRLIWCVGDSVFWDIGVSESSSVDD